MKPEIKKRWVEALRSGKYPQAKAALRNKYGYCCLGVLCDLAIEEGIGHWGEKCGESDVYPFITDNASESEWEVLPISVQEWAGLEDRNPTTMTKDRPYKSVRPLRLSALNDDGVSFNKIADLISEHL